jgi:hypothetical protein
MVGMGSVMVVESAFTFTFTFTSHFSLLTSHLSPYIGKSSRTSTRIAA